MIQIFDEASNALSTDLKTTSFSSGYDFLSLLTLALRLKIHVSNTHQNYACTTPGTLTNHTEISTKSNHIFASKWMSQWHVEREIILRKTNGIDVPRK